MTNESAKREVARKFAIGRTTDGYVNVTSMGDREGVTVTKVMTREAARELAIQILGAAQ